MTSAYTPLETLLLFQALRHEGTNNNGDTASFSFNRISEQLKAVPAIRNDSAYDGGRLSPDALRELYLWLLKEEVKRDLDQESEKENHATTNGGSSLHVSRKRKASSPSAPTVQEAAKHTYLIPQLISRLYATYRERAIKEVREHERRYDALTRDVHDIESGKWDDRLQWQRNASATRSPWPSTLAHTQPSTQRPDHVQPAATTGTTPGIGTKSTPSNAAEPKRYSQAKIDAVINHGPEPQNGYSGHRRTSSGTTLPPLSEMTPKSPHFGIPPKLPPAPMPPHLQQQQYAYSPPHPQHVPFQPHHAHPMASPQLQQSLSRPSSSPRPILPPPPGMKLPPPSPVQHVASPGFHTPSLPPQHYAQPHHRSSLGPSPTSERPLQGYPPQMQAHGYYQQSQYADLRTSYPPPQAQAQHSPAPRYPTQPPHQGGYQLQPWMVDGVPQHRPPQKQAPYPPQQAARPQQTPIHAQHRPPSYPPQYPSAPATAPRPAVQPQSRIVSNIITALATPPRQQRVPVWKSERRPPPVVVPDVPSRPDFEPLSPVLQRAKTPVRPQRAARKRGTSPVEEPANQAKARTRRTRGQSPHSVVSSAADDLHRTRTRSQSVNTVTGGNAVSDDRVRSIKAEPSTPAETAEVPIHEAEPSATPAAGPMTRKRRGTLQSLPQPASKRKRQESPVAHEDDAASTGTPPPRPNTVLATRNFAKVASAIMNDIQSHKHAAYFAKPVSEKDASGYSEIIKQPQQLKAIRSAIAAGTRAVSAATASMDLPVATPSTSSTRATDGATTVEIERVPDLMPPKAIVNAAQLEKEVYRMFANAVMFNPGEDGLVAYTREMFEDVEAKMREWRGAERDAGTGDAVTVADEEEEGKGKRRKL